EPGVYLRAIRLVCFNPDFTKSVSFSEITSSKPATSCESCEEIIQMSQSLCCPGTFRIINAGRNFPVA
ncbi:MAG: hypothetical protein V2L15_00725, partial [Desulfobacteraceae bacterium]|nr:hypothetical protein [Desulfobacteraceae bacterium]